MRENGYKRQLLASKERKNLNPQSINALQKIKLGMELWNHRVTKRRWESDINKWHVLRRLQRPK